MRLDRITHPSASWIQDEINEKEDKKSPNFEKNICLCSQVPVCSVRFPPNSKSPFIPSFVFIFSKSLAKLWKNFEAFFTNYILKLD